MPKQFTKNETANKTYLSGVWSRYRGRYAARQQTWKDENRDRQSVYFANYRRINAKRIQEYGATYIHSRRGRLFNILKAARRKARRLNASGTASPEQLQARWEFYGGRCYVCSRSAEAFDHVKPLAKGGSLWPANLRPICKSCNSRKRDKWPFQYA